MLLVQVLSTTIEEETKTNHNSNTVNSSANASGTSSEGDGKDNKGQKCCHFGHVLVPCSAFGIHETTPQPQGQPPDIYPGSEQGLSPSGIFGPRRHFSE